MPHGRWIKYLAPLVSLAVAALSTAPPARAQGLEQAQMRAIANLTRLTFGCSLTTDPDAATMGVWTLQPPPSAQLQTPTGGSPNQVMLARTWYYGWALRAGTATDKSQARALLLEAIDWQSRSTASGGPYGHYYDNTGNRNEELTSSHFQLWAAALTGAYVFALGNGGGITASSVTGTPEGAIRDSARRWWADEKRLWDLIARPNSGGVLEIDSPGARFTSTAGFGTNGTRDDLYRLLRDKTATSYDCTFHKSVSSVYAMTQLRALPISLATNLATALPGETAAPRLWDTLCVYGLGNDWLLYFPKMRGVLNPLFWVRLQSGTKVYAQLDTTAGVPVVPQATNRPQNMPGATVRTILGLGAGASACPAGADLQTFAP
jgi:hypothetical protein